MGLTAIRFAPCPLRALFPRFLDAYSFPEGLPRVPFVPGFFIPFSLLFVHTPLFVSPAPLRVEPLTRFHSANPLLLPTPDDLHFLVLFPILMKPSPQSRPFPCATLFLLLSLRYIDSCCFFCSGNVSRSYSVAYSVGRSSLAVACFDFPP